MFIVHVLHRIAGMNYFACSIISGGIVLLNLLFIAHYSGMLKLETLTRTIVYEKKLKYYKFLENLSSVADKITDMEGMANYVLDSLADTMGIEAVTLYLYNEGKSEFELTAYKGVDKQKISGITDIPATDSLVKFLKEGNVYVTGENKDFVQEYDLEQMKKTFKKLNGEIAVPLHYSMPLYYNSDVVGFLNMGDKKDKSPYGKEDMDILNAFARQLSICIDKAKLYSRATEDDLTKLYRVNYFNTKIQEEIERSSRYARTFSLLLIDVDDFKKINDTLGHQAGDAVLKRIANLIKSNIRKADIAARYGGEEFCVLMPETNKDQAIIGAERIRRAVEKNSGELLERSRVTVSTGIADYRLGMKKYDIIKAADEALYKAKREGKNRVC